jgi:hypothetical protein
MLALYTFVSLSMSGVACVAESDGDGRAEGTSEALQTKNALTSNRLTKNALTSNELTSRVLTSQALTATALLSDRRTEAALHDPLARSVLKYIVGCALPAGDSLDLEVDGERYAFPGEIGLAKAWGSEEGTCDAGCKAWVSACVLSRVNYLGVPVEISVRGAKAELAASTVERALYARREATYYGDIFGEEQRYLACLSPGVGELSRVCGPSIDDCVMDVVGPCDAACDKPRADGSFRNCRDQRRGPAGKFPRGTKGYPASVTVFLR